MRPRRKPESTAVVLNQLRAELEVERKKTMALQKQLNLYEKNFFKTPTGYKEGWNDAFKYMTEVSKRGGMF